jgi:alkanesulfonate monooxygenase SsuD/methylene tetrahydromethanopterin reductase-like flavin-dependent oxidoreductase (luciferase family)
MPTAPITGASTIVNGAPLPVPIIIGALGTPMLRIAGELADGTVTFLVGPRTVGDHVVPTINAAAAAVGRPVPRVAVGLPVAITDDPGRVRVEVARDYAGMARLSSYRAMLEREGVPDVGSLAVAGDERSVAAAIERLAGLGATDLNVTLVGTADEQRRTLRTLGAMNRSRTASGRVRA